MSHATFTDRDILSGRGGKVNRHSGNRVFRRLVEAKKDLYKSLLRKEDKALLICSILQAIRSQGARFLKQDELTGKWYELDETEVFNKTSQAFREPDKKGQRSGSDDGSSSPRPGSVSPMSSIASKREFSLEECEPQLAVEDNRMPLKQEPAGSCRMQPPVVRQPAAKRLLDDDEPLPIDSRDFRSSPFPMQMAGPPQTLVSAFNKRPRPNQQRPLTTFPTRLPQKRPGMMPPRPDQHRMEVAKYMTGLDPKNKVLAPSQASQDIFSFMKGISFGASCGPAEARNLGSSQASQDLLSIMKSGSIGGNADLLGSLKGNDQQDSRRVPPSRQASEDFFRFMRSASIGELDFFKTEKAEMLSVDGTNQQQSPSQDNKRSRAPPSRQASQDFLRFMRSASIGELDFLKSEKFEMLGSANADQQQQPQDKRMAPPRQPSQDFLRFMTSASIGGDLDFFKSEKADLLGDGMEQQDKRRVPSRQPSEELLRFMKSASIGELDFLKSEKADLLGGDQQDKRRAPSRQPSEDFLRFMRSASVGELDFFKPETADLLSGPAGKETADGADQQQQDLDKRRAPSRRTSEDFLRFMRSASIGEMENRGTEKPSQDFFLRLMQSVSSVGDINQGDADPMTILSDQEDFMKLMREGSVGPAAAAARNANSNEPLTKQDTVDLWQHCMRSLPRCDSICSTIL